MIFPLLKSVTATIIIIDVMWIWNDFLLPLLMVNGSPSTKTLTLAAYTFWAVYVRLAICHDRDGIGRAAFHYCIYLFAKIHCQRRCCRSRQRLRQYTIPKTKKRGLACDLRKSSWFDHVPDCASIQRGFRPRTAPMPGAFLLLPAVNRRSRY